MLFDVLVELYKSIKYRVVNSVYIIALLLEFSMPYIMYRLGYSLYISRGGIYIGSELLLPIVLFFIVKVLKEYAKKKNIVDEMPIPDKRYTRVDEEGNVHMDRNKYMEMMIYVANVENYLERHGKL